jgi:hypothetical protein
MPLARYRPVQPTRAAGAYVRRFTRPGDLVVDLFCQGPAVARETVAAGRRVLGLSVNPLLLVAAHLGLDQPGADALSAAFTRLADSLKGDVPLHRHMASLYRSACPACGASGIAVWFAWDRDGDYPFRKAVRCPQCEAVQEGVPDDEDVVAAQHIQPRRLAYYYALDRVAPPGHPARDRAAELVDLYTPRNLSALMDLSLRFEELEAGEPVRTALAGLLLDCFDLGSSLDPYGEERPRPRTLRVPSRYLERNVWLCVEDGLARLLAAKPSPPVQRAEDAAALVGDEAAGYALASHAARDVAAVVPPASAALIFADPPRPDGVFWALSALWAGWLWDSPAAHALRPFLRRRRFDWDWHWRVLRTALHAVGPLLTPGGHLVTFFSDPEDAGGALLASVCLAASSAGYILEGWGHSPEVGHRFVWRWEGAATTPPPEVEALEPALLAGVEEVAVSTLQSRGEPTGETFLHASVYAELARRGLLARVAAIPESGDSPRAFAFATGVVRRAIEGDPLVQLVDREEVGGALWWLSDVGHIAEPVVSGVEPPLADRVEAQVWELLAQQPAWDPEELVLAVCACFPVSLTPDMALVRMCIESYSVLAGETLRLRPEDDPARRAAELKALRDDLAGLGKRLGFKVRQRGGWDVCWMEAGQEAYVFAVSAAVALGHHLLARRATGEGVERCLVVPGGRARLIGLRLQRDPRLARAVEADGWQFIKFRHLRRLVDGQELDRHALKTVLGLDPIIEQEAAQIPLF